MDLSVDLISDLNLDRFTQFDWTGKPTSLFCIVAGNISSDLDVVKEVLEHLGTLYRGVFYIEGTTEHKNIADFSSTIESISDFCKPLSNVIYMHTHVVVLNTVAFVAVNGWYNSVSRILTATENFLLDGRKNEDLGYLSKSIQHLQLHKDASKIVVISSCTPSEKLFFGNHKTFDPDMEPGLALIMDTDHKVSHWLYGGSDIDVDFTYNRRRFVNNPFKKDQPYWPKRIVI